jgi:hypothetical protein
MVCADAAIGRELTGRTVRASSVHWFTLDHFKTSYSACMEGITSIDDLGACSC